MKQSSAYIKARLAIRKATTAPVCAYCERRMLPKGNYDPLCRTDDHTIPLARGGRNVIKCCWQCNQLKGDLMPAEWRAFMRGNPRWWETFGTHQQVRAAL